MAKELMAAEVIAKVKPGDALAWPPEHKSKALVIGQDFGGRGGHGDPEQLKRQMRTGLFLEDKYGNHYTMRFTDDRPPENGAGHAAKSGHVPSPKSRPGTRYIVVTSDKAHGTYPEFYETVLWYPSDGRVRRPLEGGAEAYRYRKSRRRRTAPDPEFHW